MSSFNTKKEILASDMPAIYLKGINAVFGGELVVLRADTKDELISELARGHQPICIIEHQVSSFDPVKEWAKPNHGLLHQIGKLSEEEIKLPAPVTAFDLLPELVAMSPDTKFVITSHVRGSGLSPEQRELYKSRKEVLKVMGFINSTANYNYLMKLFSRVYFDKTWKPNPLAA